MTIKVAKKVASCIYGINWRERSIFQGILKHLNLMFPAFEWAEDPEEVTWLQVMVNPRKDSE